MGEPATGERATILELPWTNPEGRMVAELTALVGARFFGEHRHPTVVERFTALQGELTVKRDGQTSILREGETAVVDPGGGTTGGTPATRTPGCAYRPHRASAGFTRSRFCGASDASLHQRQGMPNPLQLALFAREFSDVGVFRRPPPEIQGAIFGALAPIARWRGYRATYPQLSRTLLAPRE